MSNFTIEGFNLNEHLPEVETTVEDHREWGGSERTYHKEKQLSDSLTLFLYESGQAALEFGDKNGNYIEFLWTREVAEAFNEIDTIKVVDLFDVLLNNRIKLKGD